MLEQSNTILWFSPFRENQWQPYNISEVAEFSRSLPGLSTIYLPSELPLTSPENTAPILSKADKLIIAGEKAGFYKSFFSRAMQLAGKDPRTIQIADFEEYSIAIPSPTERAKAVIVCAFYNVSLEEITGEEKATVHPDTLVIGAGIAGIQASLEIANANQKVYLVEKTGSIGGHMAMFDKTFPTLDCAACILTPKMVDVGQHSYIELMTYSEVKEVRGEPGEYKVKILRKARKVNISTCIGCGICAEKCPSKVPSEFDQGIALRRAAYIPFPQAVPNKYLIDAEHCLFIQEGKCGACVKVCPVPNCIDLMEKDQEVEITVGNIIMATGFKIFDAKRADQYGYGKFPNVLTSLEFERLVNSAGPTEGAIVKRTPDKKGNWIFKEENPPPQSVALIHCIGSRDENYNEYCSGVCCMYSLKLAHLVKEKLPEAEVFEYYIDMRAFGKGYEEFYNRIEEEGIHIVRGRATQIKEINSKLLLRYEDIEAGHLREQEVDMVVLAVGIESTNDSNELARMVDIQTDKQGWLIQIHQEDNPIDTATAGVTIAGMCQGPKDIPETVAQASAAASRVLQSIMRGKRKGKNILLNQIIKKAEELAK